MPQYHLQQFQALVSSGDWGFLNRRAEEWKEELGWDDATMETFLLAIRGVQSGTVGDFKKIVPKCAVNQLPGTSTVDADMYLVSWDEAGGCRCAPGTKGAMEFSVKIAIVVDSLGNLAGVVSFHPSGSIS
nr:hypothetical protein [uncultured Albidiferax sp.]